jgi:CTP:molybdopterin cytidylyltransferase MocA
MGQSKALLTIDGETFVTRIARELLAAGCQRVVIITRAAELVWRELPPTSPLVELLPSIDPERGQLCSLQTAVLATRTEELGVLAALVDHPAVAATTYRALLDTGRAGAAIALPVCDGRRGHPVWWGRSVFAELLAADSTRGARDVVQRDPTRVVAVPVSDREILRDVDYPADYQALLADSATHR